VPRGICKLCLMQKDLQDSHLLPSSLYKKTRKIGAKNPNPLLMNEKGIRSTSRQISDYVLCRDCEQLFNKNGEGHVLKLVATGTRFPLLDTLRKAVAVRAPGVDMEFFAKTATPSIDREKLVYFALSVFWRASVHDWNHDGTRIIDLGKQYQEEFRRYLLGTGPFPPNLCVNVVACTDNLTRDAFCLPFLSSKKDFHLYSFIARGIMFYIQLGKNLPGSVRRLCTLQSPEQWISTLNCEAKLREAYGYLRKKWKSPRPKATP
jgi:hypothetical protein